MSRLLRIAANTTEKPANHVKPPGSIDDNSAVRIMGVCAALDVADYRTEKDEGEMLQKRNARVFAATIASIIVGGLILRILGGNPPATGAFSLSGYYKREPAEDAISSRAEQFVGRWNRIEIYCGQTFGNASDCHFIVCSRPAAEDGQAAATENWKRQLSIAPDKAGGAHERTIRICVAADGRRCWPTDSQIKRTEAVVEALSRKFDIPASAIDYPHNWWLAGLSQKSSSPV